MVKPVKRIAEISIVKNIALGTFFPAIFTSSDIVAMVSYPANVGKI